MKLKEPEDYGQWGQCSTNVSISNSAGIWFESMLSTCFPNETYHKFLKPLQTPCHTPFSGIHIW